MFHMDFNVGFFIIFYILFQYNLSDFLQLSMILYNIQIFWGLVYFNNNYVYYWLFYFLSRAVNNVFTYGKELIVCCFF